MACFGESWSGRRQTERFLYKIMGKKQRKISFCFSCGLTGLTGKNRPIFSFFLSQEESEREKDF